jgi:nitrile hydratase subunit beta
MSARFEVGARVHCRRMDAARHHRVPGYAQDHEGEVIADRGEAPRPAVPPIESPPEPVYGVQFEAEELWPGAGSHTVMIDLWESYLEPAAPAETSL